MSKLDEIGRRIEALALGPDWVPSRFLRLARPLLRKRPPRLETVRMDELLGECARNPLDERKLAQALAQAHRELRGNVTRLERQAVVRRAAPVAHAAWLRRVYEATVRATALAAAPEDRGAARAAAEVDTVGLLPPLALAPEPAGETPVTSGPVLDVQLAAVDHLLAAARDERDLLARRRRLLEAARQLLLEVSAALPLDPSGTRPRERAIASEIARLNLLEAAGLEGGVGLLHQARAALSRGDRARLNASLVALDGFAAARGDRGELALTDRALRALWNGDPDRDEPIGESARALLGKEVCDAVDRGYQRLRAGKDKVKSRNLDFMRAYKEYLAPGSERATFSAALACDGCFDVGGTLSPARVKETFLEIVSVVHPTQDMALVPARDVGDVRDAIIEDPRAVLLDLAAGKLLTRRYARPEPRTRTRTVMQSEVRVYVLDGSDSMIGPRARMRDAILVAELATVARRSLDRRTTRVTLFYRYFNEALGPLARVDTAEQALERIEEVMATPRQGLTELEKALLDSFAQVRAAQASDRELARAQIVLVTDGEANVDAAKVEAARAALAGLPLGVSVIALGAENAALRAIVAAQRARGVRAFYRFVPDDDLLDVVNGNLTRGPAIHLPAVPGKALSPDEARAAQADLAASLDELFARERSRDVEALDRLARKTAGEGDTARIEAAQGDVRALERRFARWFPPPGARQQVSPPEPGTLERSDLDATCIMLASVAEVCALVGGPPLARQADAVDLLERMLPDARLTPARYLAVLATYPADAAAALTAVRDAVAGQPPARPAARRS